MSKFHFKSKSSLADRLNNSLIQVDVGPRSSASRPVRQFAALALVAGAMLSGQAHADNWFSQTIMGRPNTVQASQTNQAVLASVGVVRVIQRVELTDQEGLNAGNMVGGVAGGVIGNQVGSGKGRVLATIAGALLGGKVGGDIERSHQHQPGYQVVIHIVDGKNGPYMTNQDIVITQPGNAALNVNDIVYVTGDRDHAPRIIAIQTQQNVAGAPNYGPATPVQYIGPQRNGQDTTQSVNQQYAHPTTSVNAIYGPR